MAYFTNDGNLMYFTHYSGPKNCILYYFFLAAFQIQLGYYQDLILTDRYPLNLIYKQPLLGAQDFAAPFSKFLRSAYTCTYDWIDSDMAPSEIRLTSSAVNKIGVKTLQHFEFSLLINAKGIHQLKVNSGNLKLEATCTD
jgi:hypothetical protein